jgi:hypothetical protein
MEILFILVYGVPRLGRLTIFGRCRPPAGVRHLATLSVAWAINPAGTLDELPVLWLPSRWR